MVCTYTDAICLSNRPAIGGPQFLVPPGLASSFPAFISPLWSAIYVSNICVNCSAAFLLRIPPDAAFAPELSGAEGTDVYTPDLSERTWRYQNEFAEFCIFVQNCPSLVHLFASFRISLQSCSDMDERRGVAGCIAKIH